MSKFLNFYPGKYDKNKFFFRFQMTAALLPLSIKKPKSQLEIPPGGLVESSLNLIVLHDGIFTFSNKYFILSRYLFFNFYEHQITR
jgi:hypothetical protein